MAQVSTEELASFFDTTKMTLHNWSNEPGFDKTIRHKEKNRWVYDSKKFIDWYVKNKALKGSFGFDNTDRFSQENLSDAIDYAAEKARLTKAQADHEESKVAERQKRLIPTELVIKTVVTAVIASKAKFLGIPSKIKSRFPEIEHDAMVELEEQIREALDELGGDSELPTGLVSYLEEYSESMGSATETDD